MYPVFKKKKECTLYQPPQEFISIVGMWVLYTSLLESST